MKNNNQFKVTAVIPVKKTSTRCANKNIREFNDTNLLELKIKTLKKVSSIHEIIVTSDSEEMIKIASNLGVATHKRDPRLCTNDNPGKFFRHLAEIVKTEILLHAPCTTPFITFDEYEEAISLYFKKHNEHDSVNCTTKLQEFLWDGEKPLNYDFDLLCFRF